MKTSPEVKAIVDKITKEFIDKGLIVEAGFQAFRFMVIPKDAPPAQFKDMRYAYFAGAQHLFASIMGILEPGTEPTENELNRITLIHVELERFVEELKAQQPPQQ